MGAQTRYGFFSPIGAAGGIVDLAPYAIDTFLNEEDNGKLKFGIGVVKGSIPGTNVAIPAVGAKATDFEGVTTNNRTTEYNVDGELFVKKGASVGVMRYGRIYVRVAEGVSPVYGDAIYMIISGDEAGYFTNEGGDNAVAVKGRFLGGVDSASKVATVELYNQTQA